ncbi:MAG: hypothetical protein KDJ16_01935 [Hyphomicrobiales bacterium]|nr:hypothetical protein [Hyphomicrobiales bacterium]
MSELRPHHLLYGVLVCALTLAACARPVGDFGRARPSVIHDKIMPAIGLGSANGREEPVSLFRFTDDEKRMRDMSWAIVRPPHADDWYAANLIELERTRILGPVDLSLDPRSYYEMLRREPYRSSEARYSRVANDADADAEGVRPFYTIVCRVFEADRERLRVARGLPDLSAEEAANVEARVWENRNVAAWGWRALEFRVAAYRYALERLQIETPTLEQVYDVSQAIDVLMWHVEDPDGLTRCIERDGRKTAKNVRAGRELWPDDAGIKK